MDGVGQRRMQDVFRNEKVHPHFLGKLARFVAPRNHDNGNAILPLPERLDQGRPIHVRHVAIGDEQIDIAGADFLKRMHRGSVRGNFRSRNCFAHDGNDNRPNCIIIIDNDNVWNRHTLPIADTRWKDRAIKTQNT
jgi:hypothetical protein